MMKEICAQCLQRHIDPESKQETFVFSCFNQDQLLQINHQPVPAPAANSVLVLAKPPARPRANVFRQHVLSANLKNRWAVGMCQGQHGPKVKIVREYDVVILEGPGHDGCIIGTGIADCGPMARSPALTRELVNPFGRQINGDDNLHA